MTTKLGSVAVLAVAVAALSIGDAQEQEVTIEERVAALERELATLATRVDARSGVARGALTTSDIELSGRIDRLERDVAALRNELQRIGRQADDARREASEARREALDATRLARDAARIR